MLNQSTIVLSLFLVFLSAECKKPKPITPGSDNGLPPATQTGADIFACLVNGKPWISEKSIYALGANITKDSLYVFGSFGERSDFDHLRFILHGNVQQGNTYRLNNIQENFAHISTDQDCQGNLLGYQLAFYAVDGTLNLTRVDTVRKFMSGTFNCIIPVTGCDTLHITDGRFDVRYY